MDNRLSKPRGRRVVPLVRTDLPELATLMVGHHLRQVDAFRVNLRGTDTVCLYAIRSKETTYVLWSEWERILPYLRTGFWNTQLHPVVSPPHVSLEQEFARELATVDSAYRPLYLRVLGILLVLFPETYHHPT